MCKRGSGTIKPNEGKLRPSDARLRRYVVDALNYSREALKGIKKKHISGCTECECVRWMRCAEEDELISYCSHPDATRSYVRPDGKRISVAPQITFADWHDTPFWCPKQKEASNHG